MYFSIDTTVFVKDFLSHNILNYLVSLFTRILASSYSWKWFIFNGSWKKFKNILIRLPVRNFFKLREKMFTTSYKPLSSMHLFCRHHFSCGRNFFLSWKPRLLSFSLVHKSILHLAPESDLFYMVVEKYTKTFSYCCFSEIVYIKGRQ